MPEAGSGAVYRALSDQGKTVAIKVLSKEAAEDETRLLRFYQEGRSLLQIEHPNLVKAYEIAEDHGQHYLAMEYVDGQSLADHVMQHGRMKESTALEIAIRIARGLQAAHAENIIHRDVSPKNVLIGSSGEVKLVDFEFSKQTEMDLDLTVHGKGLGTPDFMSPEQFRKAKDVDGRSDVYSLGAVLYVMLTARLPFPGETLMDKWLAKAKNHFLPPESLNKKLCPGTVSLIKKAMAADPAKRPASAKRFADLAQQCLASLDRTDSQKRSSAMPVVPIWQLVFITDCGEAKHIKATADQIEHLIQQKIITPDARISPAGQKTFQRLAETSEFRRMFRSSPLKDVIGRAKVHVKQRTNRVLGAVGSFLQRVGRALDGSSHA